MRQVSGLKHSVMKYYASWQCWFVLLVGISICGTILASILLVVDGWADALAIYVVTALTAVLLLSRLAQQWAQAAERAPAGSGGVQHRGHPEPSPLGRAGPGPENGTRPAQTRPSHPRLLAR